MNILAQMQWRQPGWWLLALLPVSFALWGHLRRRKQLHYAESHLLPWAVSSPAPSTTSRWHRAAYFFAWCLLAGAAAGPRLPLTQQTPGKGGEHRHNADIVIALDVSPALLAAGTSSARLAPVKLALLDLLERLHGERLGLVVFSTGTGLLMPLSADYDAFRYYLNLADPGLLDGSGEDIGAAIDLARTSLTHDGLKQDNLNHKNNQAAKAVLLITDSTLTNMAGEPGNRARAAAARLKQAGMRLYVLELGAGADADGTLADLAADTGGRLAQLGNGAAPWNQFYDNGLLTLAAPASPTQPHAWREFYSWLLVPATVLFWLLLYPLASFQRLANRLLKRPPKQLSLLTFSAASLLAGIALQPQPVRAADDLPRQAYAAYHTGNYAAAQILYSQFHGYQALMGEGAAAYRRRQYALAVNRFTAALLAADPPQRADALFNLGNSHFLIGNLQAAADAYTGVLRYRPQDAGAQTNLALVREKLAAMAQVDRYSAGILARGASRTGPGYPDDNGKRPAPEPQNKALGPQPLMLQDEAALQSAQAADLGGKKLDGGGVRLRPDLYSAALKKIELVEDNPRTLQKALMMLQATQRKNSGAGVP